MHSENRLCVFLFGISLSSCRFAHLIELPQDFCFAVRLCLPLLRRQARQAGFFLRLLIRLFLQLCLVGLLAFLQTDLFHSRYVYPGFRFCSRFLILHDGFVIQFAELFHPP